MPIHLIWGDDTAESENAIERIINQIIDPAWNNINLSRLDGDNPSQVTQALEEARTPPFGSGGRVVLLKKSPICNGCSNELSTKFEGISNLIPENTHLILSNTNKPDGRLKTTKTLKSLIKSNQVKEENYSLPPIWDISGQKLLVTKTAKNMNIEIDEEGILLLVEAIGNNSQRLRQELTKLALHASKNNEDNSQIIYISSKSVRSLIDGISTNVFKVCDALIDAHYGKAISLIDALLDNGEPSLRIVATLSNQIRGFFWVSMLDLQGEKDLGIIAKAAGIANPKRIYIMRKQIQGKTPEQYLKLLSQLLEVEASIKNGVSARNAFRDGFMSTSLKDSSTHSGN